MCIIMINGTTVIEFRFFNWKKKKKEEEEEEEEEEEKEKKSMDNL